MSYGTHLVGLSAEVVEIARKFAHRQYMLGRMQPGDTRQLIEDAIMAACVLSCADPNNVPAQLTDAERELLDPNGTLGLR